ncbi:MAG: RNA polymerase sigma factor [Fimbriimonadaceae bacterium]
MSTTQNPNEQFEKLLNEHKDNVYRQLLRACGNQEDAEDTLVEAMLKAYKYYESLEDKERFQAWLAIIGRRVCRRVKKKEALLPIVELFDQFAAPTDNHDFDQDGLVERVHSALDVLNPEERAAFELRDLKGLSGQEAANQLGISLPALKSRIHRAREKIRYELDACLDC